ncbi:TetR/AcrR family transcriptional regulator, partial [Aquitalea magnusonii]|uniref:TetR/AcrR family transcriptional regulator n=1 Tax=Aquitalea magnusonii TaxID=332411 RepID=UPI0007502353
MKSTLKRKTGISPTASRIAQASLQLFNQQGERNVTTNHIARHLAMSTGNLYYHFSSKEDIIQALYQSYGDRMAWLLAEADARRHSLEELVVVLDAVLQHQWDYRFLLQSSASLFPFNAQLRASYQKFEVEQIAVGIESLFLKLREDGLFEGSVAAIRMLAVHFQLLQAAWIAHPERAGSRPRPTRWSRMAAGNCWLFCGHILRRPGRRHSSVWLPPRPVCRRWWRYRAGWPAVSALRSVTDS